MSPAWRMRRWLKVRSLYRGELWKPAYQKQLTLLLRLIVCTPRAMTAWYGAARLTPARWSECWAKPTMLSAHVQETPDISGVAESFRVPETLFVFPWPDKIPESFVTIILSSPGDKESRETEAHPTRSG